MPVAARPAPPEPRARSIHRFAIRVALVLVVLGWAPGIDRWYAQSVQWQVAALLGHGSQRWVESSWVDPDSRSDRSDTMLLGWVRGESERRWRAVFSVRRRGYWPLATWLAALIATPMARERRLRGIALGAVALDVWLLAQIAALAACAFGATGPHAGPIWARATALAMALFNSPVPTCSVLFALWVWLANPAEGIDWSRAARALRRRLGWEPG